MPTTSAGLVSLQAPKGVSIDDIEAELREIWKVYSNNEDGLAASRATTFTLIVYEPEQTQHLLSALGFYTGPIDGIAGPRTAAGIKAAQKAYGIEVTGNSNEELRNKLRQQFDKAKDEGTLTKEGESVVRNSVADQDGAGIADAIASSNPCRIITLCPTTEDDDGVTVQVSAYCPVQKRKQNSLVCCEYISLRGNASALEKIGGVISALLIPGLPKFVWWKATPEPEYGLFKRLVSECNKIIIDSSNFNQPEDDLLGISKMVDQGIAIADLNWARLAAWQELTAEAFDPPERRSAISEIDRITIDYEKGNPSQAFMYLGWLASRLKWVPVSYIKEGGDYDIRRVKFSTADQRIIEAELAGIPLTDWGNVLGDLMSLRLTSTNLQADCCTVLCSESTGCMRMEASGGAQSCRIRQVTPLSDQKTESLLGDQLQRWGRDILYQESLTVAYQILQLTN